MTGPLIGNPGDSPDWESVETESAAVPVGAVSALVMVADGGRCVGEGGGGGHRDSGGGNGDVATMASDEEATASGAKTAMAGAASGM